MTPNDVYYDTRSRPEKDTHIFIRTNSIATLDPDSQAIHPYASISVCPLLANTLLEHYSIHIYSLIHTTHDPSISHPQVVPENTVHFK